MNSSTQQRLANIIIDSSIITISSVNVCLSIGLFGLISCSLFKRKHALNQVALLLTANLYLAMFIFSVLLLDQHIYALLGRLSSFPPFTNRIRCQTRAYLLLVSVSGIYYSNAIQSIYRLCRVVFYTNRSLQSIHLYTILVIILWTMCFVMKLPTLLLGYFQYSANDYHCQVEYTNFRIVPVNVFWDYFLPMLITIGCYVYTLKKTRRNNHNLMQTMTQIEQISARRDMIVLSRICILLGLLLSIFLPSIVVLFVKLSIGYLPWWSSQIQWFIFSLIITCIIIVLAIVFPHIRYLWKRNSHREDPKPLRLAIVRID